MTENKPAEDIKALEPDTILPVKQQNKGLVKSAKDFFDSTFGGKSADLNTTIEDFTSEMTLVIEGLSDDQTRLSEALDRAVAGQTVSEEKTRSDVKAIRAELKELSDRQAALESQIEQINKQAAKKGSKEHSLSAILKQATVLVGIIAGAWVIVTILKLFT